MLGLGWISDSTVSQIAQHVGPQSELTLASLERLCKGLGSAGTLVASLYGGRGWGNANGQMYF